MFFCFFMVLPQARLGFYGFVWHFMVSFGFWLFYGFASPGLCLFIENNRFYAFTESLPALFLLAGR